MNPLTENQRWLSRKYIAYELLSSLWFIGAIWLYFYRLFITDQQVGVLDSLAFTVGLLAEVPSGALADRFGRDKLVKFGQILAGCGILIQAFGSHFVPFFVGQAVLMIGASFTSGADEALFFQRLNFDRSSVNWRKLITRISQVALIASLVANVAGGWLYGLNPRIPWIITGLAFLISSIIIWSVKDTRPKIDKKGFLMEVREHLFSIKKGFTQFFTTRLSIYVPVIIVIQGLFYTFGWGLLRIILLGRFHFDPFWGSIVIATSGIITVGILALMHKYAENISERWMISLISFSAAASLLLSIANIGIWGYFVILILYVGEHIMYPFISEVLNNQAEESERATVLSVASFLRTLPYVILAPIIGYLNTHNSLESFLITWAIIMCVAVLLYLMFKKGDNKVSLIKDGLQSPPL